MRQVRRMMQRSAQRARISRSHFAAQDIFSQTDCLICNCAASCRQFIAAAQYVLRRQCVTDCMRAHKLAHFWRSSKIERDSNHLIYSLGIYSARWFMSSQHCMPFRSYIYVLQCTCGAQFSLVALY